MLSSSIVSSGGCDSISGVKSRMSEKSTEPCDPLAAQRESGLLQVLRDLGRREAAHELLLLVAQPLLLEARADARLEQHDVDRLRQIVLGAELDRAHDVVDALERRRDHDWHVAQRQVAPELLQHLEPIHLWHLEIEQQQVERLPPQHLERHPSVLGRGDAVPHELQIARQQQPVDLVIVDDEESRAAGARFTHDEAP